jgi:23S rRNA-/tRNA-specific pseudouridylate synthase
MKAPSRIQKPNNKSDIVPTQKSPNHLMPTTLYKPAGQPLFAPHNKPTPGGDCLIKQLLADEPWRSEIDWPIGFEAGIAHRLDNDTSGAILVADNLTELATLRDWFETHQLSKTYLFKTTGTVPWDQNTCDKAIAHDKQRRSRMIVQRGKNTPHRGKWYPAVTEFKRIKAKIWQAAMQTGVTHQIRTHAAFLGLPIIELHHVGIRGPKGFKTNPVEQPGWSVVR